MKLGVIGAGNMGSAIIRGYVSSINSANRSDQIIVNGHHPEKLEKMVEELGITVVSKISALAEECDVVLVAVKPADMDIVLSEVNETIKPETLLVSIAAGKSIEQLKEACPNAEKIIRAMPNTPALVGEGITAVCRGGKTGDEDIGKAAEIFSCIGRVTEVNEKMMDAVTGLSGSGPAYVYMFMEALADGAVLCGMPRSQAYEYAAQTVLGAAKMLLDTGKHPGQLKDEVCSPGGTTIAAVRELEAGAFRSVVMEAVIAACEKSKNM